MTILKGSNDPAGERRRIMRIDTFSDSIQAISFEHHMIHKGRTYRIVDFREISNAAPKNLLFRSPGPEGPFIHMLWVNLITEAEFEINIFRSPTVTNDGTPISTIFNADDNVLDSPMLQVFEDPVISADGTRFAGIALGVGGGTPGQARDSNEFIMRASTDYLYRIAKRASGTDFVTFQIAWYESRTDGN